MKVYFGKFLIFMCLALLCFSCENEREKMPEEGGVNSENRDIQRIDDEGNQGLRAPEKEISSIPGDLSTDVSRKFRRVLTGSWTIRNPQRIVYRDVSWGKIAIQRQHYLIFDFFVSKPLLIWGAAEGGAPIDQVVGRIVGMEVEDTSVWLYYREIISWSPFETNPETGNNWFTSYEPVNGEELGNRIWAFHLWYNEDSDTLRVDPETMIAGRQYSKDSRLERVSKKL